MLLILVAMVKAQIFCPSSRMVQLSLFQQFFDLLGPSSYNGGPRNLRKLFLKLNILRNNLEEL
jgi:hypothetical protein